MNPPICDSHVHVFGDGKGFPFSADRSYTPEPATLAQMADTHASLNVGRAVIVQPSVYGDDNRETLQAIAQRGQDTTRGVVTLPQMVDDKTLASWHATGVRGVRINALFRSGGTPQDARAQAERIRDLGWHLQLLVGITQLPDLHETYRDFPVPVVFDYMGHFSMSGRVGPAFTDLLRLLREERCWVKISAPYRVSAKIIDDSHIVDVIRSLCTANPDQLVWGSDWPHPGHRIAAADEKKIMRSLIEAMPDSATADRILRTNPARLYDFGS